MTTIESTLPASTPPCDVLIVEDDILQAEELAAFLARYGLNVAIDHDGSTGLHHAATAKPRVAVLDYNMPGLDGAQVAQRIRAVSPNTAVIMISGRIGRPSDATLGKLGVFAFLNKPFSLSSLSKVIAKVIRETKRTGQTPVAPPRGIGAFFG
jgi:DNA-binding response OmpR family regulator